MKKEFIPKWISFFKLSEHGTTVRTEVLAGLTTFFCDELYPLRKPSNVVTNRYASSRSLPCNDYWIRCRDLDDGFFMPIYLMHKHLGWA